MNGPFDDLERKLQFPVVAISPAGWTKCAEEPGDLTDASPDDDLREWQAMEIYDSAGKCYMARRAFRGWPKGWLGALICRLVGHVVHVAFDLDEGRAVSVDALRQRLIAAGEAEGSFRHATTHREIIDAA